MNPEYTPARKPYTLLPGLTVIFDAEGSYCVDIEADEFARLYSAENADTHRSLCAFAQAPAAPDESSGFLSGLVALAEGSSATAIGADAVERLTRALKRAAIASVAHICDDDSGTCNFDSPALDFAACGMTRARAEEAIKSVGLYCHDWKPFKNHRGEDGKLVKAPTYLVISGFQCGQGYRRTRMAEAFCQRLNEDGFEAGMYYQMD